MDDLRMIVLAASLGLFAGASIVYGTGYQGSVAGLGIGPSVPWLRVAGH